MQLPVPAVVVNPGNGSKWTHVFELIAFRSGVFIWTAMAVAVDKINGKANETNKLIYLPGRTLHADSLVVFGVLHFVYTGNIATLILHWIPAPLFWVYFVGVAFMATRFSLFIPRIAKLSTSLPSVMFFLWAVLLHISRVVANLNSEPERTSLFVALTMGAISLQIAGLASLTRKKLLLIR
ncbi:MAG: hypothetical protein M3R72_03745 [Bacteroidota bacterium]|nr:hypothetical protein [Bacteroidota bacterium]